MRDLRNLPPQVTVYEVGPRDGLQNEKVTIPAPVKVEFVNRLSDAGLAFIEVTSFVRPGAIPQLADAEDVLAGIRRRSGTRYTALVPNQRGMERAAQSEIDGVALFTAASETFSRHNTNATIAETIQRFGPVVSEARQRHMWVRGYISTVFGCPYEGTVPLDNVMRVVESFHRLGVDELVLSDTIGVATPNAVVDTIQSVGQMVPQHALALHFHDTRGTALANVLAGLQVGVTTYDSSAGGLGGCPYAPGAAGNLSTEDLLYMLHGLGIETGVSLDRVVQASRYLFEYTRRSPSSRYFQAANA